MYTGAAVSQFPELTLGPAGPHTESSTPSSSAVSTGAEIGRSDNGQPSTANVPIGRASSFSNRGTVGGGVGSGFAHMQILDQDISPLTSPWLGAASHPVANSSGGSSRRQSDTSHTSRRMSIGMGMSGGNGNKRIASESGDEGRGARKKKSPAIQPVLGRMTTGSASGKEKDDDGKRDHERSKSPVGLRGSMNATEAFSPVMQTENMLRKGSGGSPVPENTTTGTRKSRRSSKLTPLLSSTPSNVLGVITGLTRDKTRAQRSGGATPSITDEDIRDSPSPVDLSLEVHDNRTMPPPPVPASANGMDMDLHENPPHGTCANSDNGMMTIGDMSFDRMIGLDRIDGGSLGGMGNMGLDMTDIGMDASMGAMGVDEMGSFGNGPMGMMDMNFGGGPSAQGQGEYNQEQTQGPTSVSVGTTKKNHQQPTMPVATPASMLNLSKLGGGRLGSASNSGAMPGSASSSGVLTRAQKNSRSATNAAKDANAKGVSKPSRRLSVVSPGLKPIRPGKQMYVSYVLEQRLEQVGFFLAGGALPNTDATLSSPVIASSSKAGASSETVIRQPKRTHRDAEQRRRNSQKQVIDELRRLLPPIALPNDTANNSELDPTTMSSPFFFQPTAPLLPGGLPPRGPPKTGTEGPNKHVSKLQVLLCGNEYIKLLKARLERRDDEIEMLRREIRRLHEKVQKGSGGGIEDEEEAIDLEKDLDAIERLNITTVAKGGGGYVVGAGGDDVIDEDDDDGED